MTTSAKSPRNLDDRVLSTLNTDGSRRWLKPKLSEGRYLRRRRIVGYSLILLFALLPFLEINGAPAMLFDLANRRFSLFGTTFLASDGPLVGLLVVSIFFTIFLLTALFGRVWCGYACPQTVYLELVYRPLERFFQRGMFATRPALGRTLRFIAYLLVSLFLANVFLSYFVGVETLKEWITSSPIHHPKPFLVVAITTLLMLVDFAFFREQMCTLTCPYGRFQSVLFDRATKIIAYDTQRGEPRGKLRTDEVRTGGDCIDCNLCVQTCPTGIDIRKGLQMECVACAQCVDACDTVMHKINKPKGLIRYGSLEEMDGAPRKFWRPRVVIYLGLITIVASILTTMLGNREAIDVTFVRTRATPYRETASGAIECPIQIHISNRTADPLGLKWSIRGIGELEGGDSNIHLGGFASQAFDRTVLLPRSAFHDGRAPLVLVFELPDGTQVVREKSLTGPLGEAPATDSQERKGGDRDDEGKSDHSDHDGDKR